MDWANEDWIKFYTRDTIDDLALSEQARLVWYELLRKSDKSGVIQLGSIGLPGVPALLRVSVETADKGLAELFADGRVVHVEGHLVIPNFIEAQRARKSDRQKQHEYREKRRSDMLAAKVLKTKERESADVVNDTIVLLPVTPISSLSSPQISSPEAVQSQESDSVTEQAPHPWEAPPPVALAGENHLPAWQRKLLDVHRQDATELWRLQEELRAKVALELGRCPAPLSLTAKRLLPVLLALGEGLSRQDAERALHGAARDARKKKTLEYFNGVTNWETRQTTRAIASVAERAPPKIIEVPYVPKPPPEPMDPEVRRGMEALLGQL